VPTELSGKFVIRVPPRLHASLKRRAREEGVSLNGLCLDALKSFLGTGEQGAREGVSIPLQQVRNLLGESLSGVILFGSTARGEGREGSDIDLMIVVGSELPLRRELYQRWDQGIDGASSSRLSPHFVHLPGREREAGSLWYEAAVDGIILFDREGRIARLLRTIRRSMAEGKLRRKSAYGHPYWIRKDQEVADVQ
jgi:predicted nucleotidyltransferase